MKKRLFCFVTAIITFFGVANAQKTVTIGTGTDSSVTCPVNTIPPLSYVTISPILAKINKKIKRKYGLSPYFLRKFIQN